MFMSQLWMKLAGWDDRGKISFWIFHIWWSGPFCTAFSANLRVPRESSYAPWPLENRPSPRSPPRRALRGLPPPSLTLRYDLLPLRELQRYTDLCTYSARFSVRFDIAHRNWNLKIKAPLHQKHVSFNKGY